jgi:acyl dehydratase
MTDSERVTAEEVSVGDTTPPLVIEDVSRVDFAKYAGASGDFNPLHVDESYAKEAGNPSVFGHGMLTAGLAGRLITDWFGISGLNRFRVRFTDQVWPGDSLTVSGEVSNRDLGEEGVTVDVDFVVTNQDSEEVLSGDATATIPRS